MDDCICSKFPVNEVIDMPKFKGHIMNENMNNEVCDFFTAQNRKTDRICKYFTGDRNKERDIDRCRHHCSILESKRMMEEAEVLVRKHGALRKK